MKTVKFINDTVTSIVDEIQYNIVRAGGFVKTSEILNYSVEELLRYLIPNNIKFKVEYDGNNIEEEYDNIKPELASFIDNEPIYTCLFDVNIVDTNKILTDDTFNSIGKMVSEIIDIEFEVVNFNNNFTCKIQDNLLNNIETISLETLYNLQDKIVIIPELHVYLRNKLAYPIYKRIFYDVYVAEISPMKLSYSNVDILSHTVKFGFRKTEVEFFRNEN